ncbi:hypothetical protein PPSIR1_38334 [Plesiocystis pacifica SIR-1]|uniref:Uncharacterized protein n=1 Tax=Plesiocystis pacifica SIR-1 TaxID=391625 RepID=A6G8J0_9BACT|nr:hypothetical protein [Plesiocystis pacifica]EDM77767.1 hypothetical protein PPSIR1_38334 [Plesiocystis pacifica SIR-1]
MKLLSPIPTADEYLRLLRQDLEGARVLRFVIAYVSESGLAAIGSDLLAAALKQPGSFGLASLSCACGFTPLVGLQTMLEPEQGRLKYFVDPVVLGSQGDPALSLVHSKIVYIVRPDNRAVIYLGSHNWSGRGLGSDTPRSAEASMRFEFEFELSQLSGAGTDLPSEINRHLLQCFNLGASLPVHDDNLPIFEDWYRARCEREKPLPLDEYAVVIGACSTDGTSTYDHLWKAILTPGASIYLPCHVEDEGQILRLRQDRVLLMAWTSKEALEESKEPVLLFCKVTRQVAGKDSAFEGTSEGDIENFDLVLHDPRQGARISAGEEAGEPLTINLHNGHVFEYFTLSPVPASVTAASIDGGGPPKYQNYLQVYQVLLPEWLKQTEDPRDVGAREQMATRRDQGVWTAANLALTTNRQVQPEVSKNYRVPQQTREQIMGCFEEFFGLGEGRLEVRPVDPNVAPKELVRLAQSRLHYGYIGDSAVSDSDAFYSRVRPGRLAVDLAPMQKMSDEGEGSSVEARVQQLYAERLREILANVGIEDADLAAWEAKPPKRKTRAVDTVRLRVFDLDDPEDLPGVVADLRQRHGTAALADFTLLKEILLLAVSIQGAGLSQTVGRPLFQRLFDDIRHADTGFFCQIFVGTLEGLAETHCPDGWPAEQRGRSNAKRAITQFLKNHALGEDRVWQMLCLEYLRGQ